MLQNYDDLPNTQYTSIKKMKFMPFLSTNSNFCSTTFVPQSPTQQFNCMSFNKVIFITGTSKGIGKAICLKALENGSTVVSFSRNSPEIQHVNFHHFSVDITSFGQTKKVFSSALEQFGRCDILINNAGLGIFGNIETLSLDDWHTMFDTNVHGLMYATRMVVPQMKAQQSGHIINISSIAGLNGITQASGYCATKHAVRGISHSLYAELRNDGIKVTCVYPGSVNTNFFDNVESVTANENMLDPMDVADSILYLASTSPNFLPVDFEIRPLQPQGKKSN